MAAVSGTDRLLRIVAIAVAATIPCLHFAAAVSVSDRPLHYDESENLHASWLMAAGKRIYRDYFEDHPPHSFVVLRAVMPEAANGDVHNVDVLDWTRRARLLSGFFGTVAVGMIMLFAWRATRNAAAPAIAAAILLSSPQLWARGLCDIRAEAPTLALFWAGVVLLTWSAELRFAQAIRAGLGIGLVFFAVIWNPKWPFEAALLGAYFLWYAWRLLRDRRSLLPAAILPGLLVAAITVLPILTTTTFSDYVFFNYQLKAGSAGTFAKAQWVKEAFARAPVWASTSPQFRWWWIVIALAIVSAALLAPRILAHWGAVDRRLALLAIALNVSALLELRFVYAYPYLWAQYLVMSATASAVVYALLPGAVSAILKPLRASVVSLMWIFTAAAISIAATAVAAYQMMRLTTGSPMWWICVLAIVVAWVPTVIAVVWAHTGRDMEPIPALAGVCAMGAFAILALGRIVIGGVGPNEPWKAHWNGLADLQARTGRHGTVFIEPPAHPIAAFDASYYWYSFREATPHAIRYAVSHPSSPLPRLGSADLPPCKVPSNLRFVEVGSWMRDLDGNCRCVEAAWRQWQLKPTDHFAIFETNADPRSPLTPRAKHWAARTANVWANFCSREARR